MKTLVQQILSEKLKSPIHHLEITKLFGHASYRTYYRVKISERTFVLMQIPPGLSSVSEEITNYKGPKNELPFINVQRYLKSVQLPVPEVHAWVPEEGLMILEDLGDRLLETYLKDTTEVLRLSFYKRAIDLLVQVQKKTQRGEGNKFVDCIAFHRSFDETLLNWEFDHFLEYGIEDRFKIKLPEEEKKFFTEQTRKITQEILKAPSLFVHRDFQSRNLILKDYELYLLDFQDALQGPEAYDLVALLRDSYIELSGEAVEKLVDYFLEARKKIGFPVQDEKAFRRLFHLVTLQRKLKDTGRFQFIHTVKGNPDFLVSVPTSLRYIQSAFEQLPEYQPLQKWIGKYVSELR